MESRIKTRDYIGEEDSTILREEVELVNGVYDPFDINTYLSGDVAPVFFGSALNNFGVQELLDGFTEISPTPRGRESDTRVGNPR